MLLWRLRKQEVWQAVVYLESKGNINTLKLWQDELLLGPPVQGHGPDYWKTVIFSLPVGSSVVLEKPGAGGGVL